MAFPKIGATIRVIPKGFDSPKTGIYTGVTERGDLCINTDPLDLLPEGSIHKELIIPVDHEFEVLEPA
jgi:hypothetical protein